MPLAELPTGATLYYLDASPNKDGVPVVLIHGLLGTAELHFPALIDWLKPDYRVIGPTLRGYGQSTPGPRSFPYDFYQRDADDVIALLEQLNIEKAHILGYSDGGEIALLVAGKAPERVQTVAAWGAVGYYGPLMRPVVQRMYPGDWITQKERDLHNITNPDAFVLGWMQSVKRIIDSGGDLSTSLAEKITAPLLMMLGRQDTLNPAEYARQIIDRAPNARLELFDTGHAIHDQDLENFKRVVGAHLRQ